MAIQTIDRLFVGEQAIPDLATTTNTIAQTAHIPTGITPTLAAVFINLRHTFDGDLDVSLTNPQGTSIQLFTDVGGTNEGFIVTLSDAAATDIGTAVNPLGDGVISGTFNPEGAALLSTLASGNLTGNWALTITDDAGGDTGTLFSWGYRITYDYSGTVAGTNAAETLGGSDDDDQLLGLGGNDVIQGFLGNDHIEGAAGNDILRGDAGRDELLGGDDDDTLFGDAARDELFGGNDDDTLFGGSDRDELFGQNGNDRLSGDDGNDVLTGGRGRDVQIGGLGADRFDFNAINESVRGSLRDVVFFQRAERDKIDLRDIDAERQLGGNQAFHFIGTARFSGDDGELRFRNGVLQGDTNGDRIADIEIRVLGSLTSADIFL
jgi:Ca2+-binding RTX toxin-like protein